MFFLLAILSMLGYSSQSTLLVPYARKLDTLSLATYRNISLWFTMTPLLFFTTQREWSVLPDFFFPLLGACITGTLGLWSGFYALRFLPVGLNAAFKTSFVVLLSLSLGIIFFQEYLTPLQLYLVLGLLACGSLLSLQKNHIPHIHFEIKKGLFFSFLSGVFTALSLFFMSHVSRELSPFLVGYLWEFGIGLGGLLILLFMRKKIQKISLPDFFKIALYSSPTLIGTGCFALAVTQGYFGIVSAIGVCGILVSVILSFFLYQEKPKPIQWILMTGMVLFLLGLQISDKFKH